MTAYDPAIHRTVVQANGETSRKFYSVNKLLIDMGAAGMIDLRVQDVEPSEQGAIWLDISQPEQSNGVPKIYSGAAWVPLTPQLFYDHIAGGASGYVTNAEMEAYTAAGFQPLDSDLSAIAALSTTSYGRAFLAIADAPAARVNLGVRDVLTANRTYYVRTDGSDSNDGSANTSGAAFLTIQKALDVASALDSSIYNITINVAAGTYNAAQSLKPCAGSGFITVSGAGATTIIDPPAGVNHCFQAIAGGRFSLTNMKLQKTSATTGHAIFAEGGSSLIQFQGIEFGAMNGGGGAGRHVYATAGARIVATGAYSISGAAACHFSAANGGSIFCNQAVTLTGTPAFTRFADASLCGTMRVDAAYSGSATGVRYLADTNSVIWVVGGGASFLPGNSAGSVTNGGQYV